MYAERHQTLLREKFVAPTFDVQAALGYCLQGDLAYESRHELGVDVSRRIRNVDLVSGAGSYSGIQSFLFAGIFGSDYHSCTV